MKTTANVLNKYILVYNSVFFKQYVVYKSTVLSKYRLLYTMYMVRSYMESDSMLVADGNTTSAVSPTRRVRNRRQNVYASLEVCIFWIGCLISTTTVVGTY